MKKLVLILSLVFMLFVAGCSSNSSDGKKNGYDLGSFAGGEEALNVEFTEGQPPEKVIDGGVQPFNIRFLIKNVGESDIAEGEGYVVISGVDPELLNLQESSKALPELRGVRLQGDNTIDGSIQPITFSNMKYMETLSSGSLTQQISVDVCYPYKTKSMVSMCISGNTVQSFEDDLAICELEGERKYANSGAPLRIENVVQAPAGSSSLQLRFDIVHDKPDESNRVYRFGSFDEQCKVRGLQVASLGAKNDEDYVSFTVDGRGLDVDCGDGLNSGEVLLTDDRASVFCTINTAGEEDYEKPIQIELDYDYFQRNTLSFTVEHVER